jgi:hypothetical protein
VEHAQILSRRVVALGGTIAQVKAKAFYAS